MRLLGFIMLLAGLVAVFGHRFIDLGFADFEIGTYAVFNHGAEFQPVTVDLVAKDAPLKVMLDVAVPETAFDSGGESTLTLVINNASGTVAAEVITVSSETADVLDNGMLGVDAIMIDPVEPGYHIFVVGAGDRDELDITAVELALIGNAGGVANEYQPIGFTLIAVGGVLILLGGRKKRRAARGAPKRRTSGTSSIGYREPEVEAEEKPSVSWGRGDDTDR
jgi:hypothetical protein